MKKYGILLLFWLITNVGAMAQCAMCRATLENNVSNGDPSIAASINLGIMYLFVAPYLAIGTIAYFWYKTSKANAQRKFTKSPV